MSDRNTVFSAAEHMPTQALIELLQQEQDPEKLLQAAEALCVRPDAGLPRTDKEAALARFRSEYLPTAELDPDAPDKRRGSHRLVRILPLAAILVIALGMLVFAGQQERARFTSTVITRHSTTSDINYVHTDGLIPSFGITLSQHFKLEDTTSDGETETLIYRDAAQPSRTVLLSFTYGNTLSFAPKDPDHYPPEEITLPNFSGPCYLTDFGDTIEVVIFDFEHSDLGYYIVIETHGLTREETLSTAESFHILMHTEL